MNKIPRIILFVIVLISLKVVMKLFQAWMEINFYLLIESYIEDLENISLIIENIP